MLISAMRCHPLDVRGTLVLAALFSPVNAGRYRWSVERTSALSAGALLHEAEGACSQLEQE